MIFEGSGFVLDIPSLQKWLEIAWTRGFDVMGADSLDIEIYGWQWTGCCWLLFFWRNRERNCGNSDVIPAIANNHGEFNGIPAADVEVVLETPTNNYSLADIFLDQILGAEDLWLLPKKMKDRAS